MASGCITKCITFNHHCRFHTQVHKKLLTNVTMMTEYSFISKWAALRLVHKRAQVSSRQPKPWLHMTGSVNGSIRRSGASQVALTSGPLALSHCNDTPRHWEPVEIISSGPESAEGRLAHCLLRIASHSHALNLTCQLWGQFNPRLENCPDSALLNLLRFKFSALIQYGFWIKLILCWIEHKRGLPESVWRAWAFNWRA